MEQRFLIDTNIVIYYANGMIPPTHFAQVSDIFRQSFLISTVTKVEVLGWHKISPENQAHLKQFISHAKVIYINEDIEAKAIEIRQLQKMGIADALIAATAVCYSLTLVTRNVKDFEHIQGLVLYNPFAEN